MMVSERNLLFQGLLFRFHVKIQGCTPFWWSVHRYFSHNHTNFESLFLQFYISLYNLLLTNRVPFSRPPFFSKQPHHTKHQGKQIIPILVLLLKPYHIHIYHVFSIGQTYISKQKTNPNLPEVWKNLAAQSYLSGYRVTPNQPESYFGNGG